MFKYVPTVEVLIKNTIVNNLKLEVLLFVETDKTRVDIRVVDLLTDYVTSLN